MTAFFDSNEFHSVRVKSGTSDCFQLILACQKSNVVELTVTNMEVEVIPHFNKSSQYSNTYDFQKIVPLRDVVFSFHIKFWDEGEGRVVFYGRFFRWEEGETGAVGKTRKKTEFSKNKERRTKRSSYPASQPSLFWSISNFNSLQIFYSIEHTAALHLLFAV